MRHSRTNATSLIVIGRLFRSSPETLSCEPGNGGSEGCGRKARRRGDTLHTAHDAPLEMPDRSRAERLHLPLPEHKPVGRGREMINLPAVEEPTPDPAKIRAVSYGAGMNQSFKRMRFV